eukprot:c39837_g1_i1 orf=129-320(+)
MEAIGSKKPDNTRQKYSLSLEGVCSTLYNKNPHFLIVILSPPCVISLSWRDKDFLVMEGLDRR